MQLHPAHFPAPWHTSNDNSDLSMQWGHLSRHPSSSVGSMESLETPSSQGYYDSQLSPVDPAIFNNKRDSAYSSFSASSNTSDYTISLRPGEANSMDNLLQGLGSSSNFCRYADGRPQSSASGPGAHDEGNNLKSRSMSCRGSTKVRPSSYGYEEERSGPPQPPMRRDSFRATRGRPGATDKRCVSAPVGIPSLSCYLNEDTPGTRKTHKNEKNCARDNNLESYYTLSSQSKPCRDCNQETDSKTNLQSQERPSSSPIPLQIDNPANGRVILDRLVLQTSCEESKQALMTSRHSNQGKLGLEASKDENDHSTSPCSQWTQSPLHQEEMGDKIISDVLPQGKWDGSRSSTPGSATSEVEETPLGSTPTSSHHHWGRSVSVPGEPLTGFSQSMVEMQDSNIHGRGFGPITAAVSVDTLFEDGCRRDKGGGGGVEGAEDEEHSQKPSQKSSRQFRSSKSRRRNERFATNLRNEIQRKKAQLQKANKGPESMLYGRETVEEEETNELQVEHEAERMDVIASSEIHHSSQKQATQQIHQYSQGQISKMSSTFSCQSQQKAVAPLTPAELSESRKGDPQGLSGSPGQLGGTGFVCGRVVEEPAPAGKARRWRWTPEHKLQPEAEPAERCRGERSVSLGLNATHVARTQPAFTRSSSRTDESDIPPFADRRKFFEETSRNLSMSVSNLPGLSSRRQRPERRSRQQPNVSTLDCPPAADLGHRRFSYQGNVQQDAACDTYSDSRRQSVTEGHERERELDRRNEEERQMLREQEEKRDREMEREREWELERREREQEIEKERERERKSEWEMERSLENSAHGFHGTNAVQLPVVQGPQKSPYSQPQQHTDCYRANGTEDACHPCSAFCPVSTLLYPENQHPLHEYTPRSYTPTEAYPVKQWEQTKLNRKFSLTERDYPRHRCDSRPRDGAVIQGLHAQWSNVNSEKSTLASSPLRSRAMSENDIRIETRIADNTNAVLQALDENGVSDAPTRRKGPPPPRPPPPKWEQYHQRRASHHNLFSCTALLSSVSCSPQPGASPGQPNSVGSCPNNVLEPQRQRSYSLPPREGPESGHDRQPAPPSSTYARGAFRPVAPPRRQIDAVQPQAEPCARFSESASLVLPAAQPVTLMRRGTAEWERRNALQEQFSGHSISGFPVPGPTLENGFSKIALRPESYFAMNCNSQYPQSQQQGDRGHSALQLNYRDSDLSPRILPTRMENGDAPLETDLDELGEVEAAEMQCYARPITVLETDMDTPTGEEALTVRWRMGPRGSLVDSLLEQDCGDRTRKELIEELFPHSPEPEAAGESWRGGHPVLEHSTENLERHSRLCLSGSLGPPSTCQNSQLLNKMFPEMCNQEEDEELKYKKKLIESLRKKLGVLREAQRGLQEDIRANAQLGDEVEALVLAVCKPNEVDKFRMFIGDLDKVVSLLLSLSGRLLRVESALDCLDAESGDRERLPLLDKKKQLLVQLGEAQELKEHVDRREQAVGRVLGRCLTPEQMRDYSHFVKMKAALLVEQKQLDDKIRLGEEQLRGLRESVGLGAGDGVGLGYGYY
ncbi:protein Shroom4 isoform X1 [Denticeps clupeoides]|nr:protein Shroom4 isoform X1 [Denticeps clupeoides]XP_028829010.1 protein Shroom4 isoform X1 [Denticeps clupeoides]XP_028829019.1 protein Shroom4 isoform X1 [Denticeps clupeoides]